MFLKPRQWGGLAAAALCATSLLLACAPAFAQVHTQDALQGRLPETSVQAGIDYWHLGYSDDKRDKTPLQLPDSQPVWPYRQASPWATISAGFDPVNHVSVRLKAQANQAFGGRVDELSATYDVSPAFGVRVGVLDFNLGWCRDYERSNPWIQDPNAFCADLASKRATGSSPGVQAYNNFTKGDYQIQSVAGIYNGRILGYDNAEGARLYAPPALTSDASHQISVATNVLNVFTGLEYHLSWLRTDREQQHDNTFYAIAQYPLNLKWTASANYQYAEAQANGLPASPVPAGSTGYSSFYDTRGLRTGVGTERQYSQSGTDKWVFGLSLLEVSTDAQAIQQGVALPEAQREFYRRHAFSLAWRHDWQNGAYSTLQWIHTTADGTTGLTGDGLGLRIGYQF